MRLIDLALAFPSMLLIILVVSAWRPGVSSLVVGIGVALAPGLARLARALSAREARRDYVLAARLGGTRTPRILVQEMLPNIAGPMLVQTVMTLSIAAGFAAGLSYLGLGIQPPTPDWGYMVQAGQEFLYSAPRLVVLPAAATLVFVIACNFVGDDLRDALDPRGRHEAAHALAASASGCSRCRWCCSRWPRWSSSRCACCPARPRPRWRSGGGSGQQTAAEVAQNEARISEALGLDESLREQYLTFLSDLVHLDLGRSFYGGNDITGLLGDTLPATIELTVAAMLIAMLLGVVTGVVAALRKDTWVDTLTRTRGHRQLLAAVVRARRTRPSWSSASGCSGCRCSAGCPTSSTTTRSPTSS